MKIHYVTGSRADFGLMAATLEAINAEADFDVDVIATGQHTAAGYGDTLRDIDDSQLSLLARIPVTLTGCDGAEMARANAAELAGFVELWQQHRPDLVFILGDRGEMLMAALGAAYLGIPVGHFHGGEVSGTIDESLRHAISKISHLHFAATDDARQRLIKMGEQPEHIWTVGAPGLVGLVQDFVPDRLWVCQTYGIQDTKVLALVIFHPVVQESAQAADQVSEVLHVLSSADCSAVILRPNSDAGGQKIDQILDGFDGETRFHIADHLPRDRYKNVLASVDILVGNSSSGIIESASFGVPCLNVGSRQNGRLRNDNVIDCPVIERTALLEALNRALKLSGPFENLYGDGRVPERILPILRGLDLGRGILSKRNSY